MRHGHWNRNARTRGLSRHVAGVLMYVASAACMPMRAQSPLMHLDLNLPAYRLDVFLRHERVRSYPVLIGERGTRTPRGAFVIARIEWNPGRVLPKRGCAGNGRIAPADPKTSVARVQLTLSPLLLVQGTAQIDALATASSRGCVGLASKDVLDLATLIQRSMRGNVTSDSLLALTSAGARPLTVTLPNIPIDIRYDPVEVSGDTLFTYSDPYRLGTSPWKDASAALARVGLDTMAIDLARLRRMTRYPDRLPIALPLRR